MKSPVSHLLRALSCCLALWSATAHATTNAAYDTPEAFAAPPSPPLAPQQDPFYSPPASGVLSSVAPGTVLRAREVTAKAYYLFPVKGQAWQLMYRTTDHRGQPVAMVGTVLVPTNAPATGRQLMAYNVAYDALTLRCAPSYSFVRGTALEQALIAGALKKGLVVMSPDYEGLGSFWTTGLISGQGVLDGIRAAQRFEQAGLGPSTPTVITGYSGGSIASTWANELYQSYAPELNIKGVAAGGVPVDLGNVARKVDGTLFAGVYFGAVAALANAYPEVNPSALVNAKGAEMLVKAQDMCLGQFLTGAPDPLMAFAFQRMKNLVKVPDLLEVPMVKQVIAANRLGQRKPGAPIHIYQGTVDELMPIKDVDALVQSYCDQGVKVSYKRTFNDHILLAVTGWSGALQYLSDRLADKPAPSTCR